jgi:hypothetical protein
MHSLYLAFVLIYCVPAVSILGAAAGLCFSDRDLYAEDIKFCAVTAFVPILNLAICIWSALQVFGLVKRK